MAYDNGRGIVVVGSLSWFRSGRVTILCNVSTPVIWPVGANEDGVYAVMLGGADGKAYSSSWHLNARRPLGKGEGCLLYICMLT